MYVLSPEISSLTAMWIHNLAVGFELTLREPTQYMRVLCTVRTMWVYNKRNIGTSPYHCRIGSGSSR